MDLKENNMDREFDKDQIDEQQIVEEEIELINRGIENPMYIESTASENTLIHLINLIELTDNENLNESDSMYYTRALQALDNESIINEDIEMEESSFSYLTNFSSTIIEQSKSLAESFLSMFTGKKNNESIVASQINSPSLNSSIEVENHELVAGTSTRTIVFSSSTNAINVINQEQADTHQPSIMYGHWTLIGDRDPEFIEGSLNDCLFVVVGAQIGRQPEELRRETVQYMRRHINSLAARLQALAKAKKCHEIICLIGGARYDGRSASDAGRILDNSQNGRSDMGHQQGHPRGHASNPSATGTTQSVENYSRGGWKTGFLSRDDQNHVANMVLNTPVVQTVFDTLNNGGTNQAVTVNASQIPGRLPNAAEFTDGVMGEPRPIRQVVVVVRHHAGQSRNPNYDVFVHTLYPKL
ncbi:uncharacterized protein LOC122853879 [Aphidius gifuensis]|uniref:uncharacterized protein LOC122853879 n=1 Tax=Aphidius gifuensis TaxID=684658 RepID=UPI001CDC2549|nr:uncharacterized protein LOC122853879 [Aphidius gifuensis]